MWRRFPFLLSRDHENGKEITPIVQRMSFIGSFVSTEKWIANLKSGVLLVYLVTISGVDKDTRIARQGTQCCFILLQCQGWSNANHTHTLKGGRVIGSCTIHCFKFSYGIKLEIWRRQQWPFITPHSFACSSICIVTRQWVRHINEIIMMVIALQPAVHVWEDWLPAFLLLRSLDLMPYGMNMLI